MSDNTKYAVRVAFEITSTAESDLVRISPVFGMNYGRVTGRKNDHGAPETNPLFLQHIKISDSDLPDWVQERIAVLRLLKDEESIEDRSIEGIGVMVMKGVYWIEASSDEISNLITHAYHSSTMAFVCENNLRYKTHDSRKENES